jgi:ABC-type Fe3+ transport system substrate-binding protein
MTESLETNVRGLGGRQISRRSLLRAGLALGWTIPVAGGLLAACQSAPAAPAGGAAPTAAAAAPTVAVAAATAAPTVAAAAPTTAPTAAAKPAATQAAPTVAAAGGNYNVSILGKQMSKAEIVDGLTKEGEVNVANWTYTANDAIVARFQDVVKQDWGVDVKCNYLPSQSPSVYLTNLYTANKGGNPSPYDVMAIEEPYYVEAKGNGVTQDIFPSDLMKNWEPVDKRFKQGNQAVGFQGTAFTVVVHTTDWFKEWKDLADPRLKGKITIPEVGDITNGGHLIMAAWSLGKDYKNPDDMKATVDFVTNMVKPNVLKVTTDSAEMQRLLRSGAAQAVCFWNSLARLEQLSGQPGTDKTVYTLPDSGVPVINGYMWIPKGTPHPLLAQLFINWRISSDGMIPTNKWPSEPGGEPEKWEENQGPWSEIFEGVLYPDQEKDVPSWFADSYKKFYPPFSDYDKLKAIDWDYYAAHQKDWQDAESKALGL